MKRKFEDFMEAKKKRWGDGEHWLRGKLIGVGATASVFHATRKKQIKLLPSLMVVKSSEASESDFVRREAEILAEMKGCPFVIECFGEEITRNKEGDLIVYNLLLEYASGGTLADLVERSNGRGLPESDVKKYTQSILEGVKHIHKCDYVHCDLKSENILLVARAKNFVAKIADFGFGKRSEEDYGEWRGTREYLSPEALNDNEQEKPSDIWSLGCIVLEMLTGNPIQDLQGAYYGLDDDFEDYMMFDKSYIPKIPGDISGVARDFIKSCIAIKPEQRLTAEKLLLHPFVAQPQPPPSKAAARHTKVHG